MSIYLSIGSSEDIDNLQKTVNYLRNLDSLDESQLKKLLSWYETLLNILYNGGNTEDYSDKNKFYKLNSQDNQ
jgi:hypothetical protein